jgi:hypothetical protein
MKKETRTQIDLRITTEIEGEMRERRVYISNPKTIAKLRWDRGYLGRILRGVR